LTLHTLDKESVMIRYLVAICSMLAAASAAEGDAVEVPRELTTPNYRVSAITGIGAETGVERQDPSNVIKVADTYYVWYTRRTSGVHAYASTVSYATSKDGRDWTEQGEALGKGAADAWDSFGVITPYVAIFDSTYYLYYTGTHAPQGFRSRDPDGTLRHIGVAVADKPGGPWKRFDKNPVFSPGRRGTWDELLVDDAHVIKRQGKHWLYFKGGHGTVSPADTQWGVAIGESPVGPFARHEANPLIGGHTVCLWPHRRGIAALIDKVGPESHTVQWSTDGIHFTRAAKTEQPVLTGCGPYDPDAFTDDGWGNGIMWGVAQQRAGGNKVHIARFDIDAKAPPCP
jgi:hypothetical protein